jgi:hypothetical protein
MPVYDCYRGQAEGMALEREGCFTIRDTQGRDWLCFESNLPTLAEVDKNALMQDRAKEIAERIARMWAVGVKLSTASCHIVECAAIDDLPALLAESKDPEPPAS